MKVVATTVGRKGPEAESHNEERLRAGEQAVAKASTKLGADVIVLPAGFFTASSSRAGEAIATALINAAKQLNVAIIFGVDHQAKNPKTDWEILSKGLLLPYYGYSWSPTDENSRHCWQQRSSTSANQWYASDERCKEPRLLRIGDETIAVLMCGEIFNQRIRSALAKHYQRPKVIADVAHIGSGFRVWQGMKPLAAQGLTSVCSVHAQCEYAMKHCYVPGKGRMSSRDWDVYIFGPPRIELKLWTF